LNQEDINDLIRSIKSNRIEPRIKNLPKKKSLGPHGYLLKSIRPFKEEITPTLLKSFHKIKMEGTLHNSFYESSVTLITKPDKDTQKGQFSLMQAKKLEDLKILIKVLES
jgi:hypothetical protein